MIKIGDEIELSEKDQKLCKKLAWTRYSTNRYKNVASIKIGNQSSKEVEIQGIGGEFALCRLLRANGTHVTPDFTTHIRSSRGIDKGDITLPNGKTVDVKTTPYEKGRLIAPMTKELNVDYFALMIGRFPRFRYVGSINAGELLKDYRIGSLGWGDTYIMEQKELKELI
jgi:hypothetical protein